MDPTHAQALPDDVIIPADSPFLRYLVIRVAQGIALEQMLSELAEQIGVTAIALVRPGDRPPDMRRVVVAALQVGDTQLGDLYAALTGESDSMAVAARLAFFAPVIALCAVVK